VKWWHVLGAIGRFMVRAGAVILLFVAYQLWGTGFATSAAQDRLTSQFESQLAQYSTTTTTTVSPSAPPPVTAPVDLPVPALGDPIGRLTIPKIDSDFIMLQGVDLRWLQAGPGHFPQTPMPGQPGNAAIAGHRTTYKAPFNRLDELEPGDQITVQTLQGTFLYVVDAHPSDDGSPPSGHIIVKPTDAYILEQGTDNRLTLMACNPKYSAAQRIVVTATLTSPPAPPTPIPVYEGVTTDASIDALAGGDQSARPEAIAWSLAAIAAWFATWFLARRVRGPRWTKWLVYLVGTPIVLLFLFFAYENIARLLPASF
jgi:sortase A